MGGKKRNKMKICEKVGIHIEWDPMNKVACIYALDKIEELKEKYSEGNGYFTTAGTITQHLTGGVLTVDWDVSTVKPPPAKAQGGGGH